MKNYTFKSIFGSEQKILKPINNDSELKLNDIVIINNKHYIITKIF